MSDLIKNLNLLNDPEIDEVVKIINQVDNDEKKLTDTEMESFNIKRHLFLRLYEGNSSVVALTNEMLRVLLFSSIPSESVDNE